MALHRVAFFVLALCFTAGMTSVASAGCCGFGAQAPVATYAPSGCGRCGTPTAALVYAEPVAPAPPPPPPVAVTVVAQPVGWAGTCGCPCGCRGLFSTAAPAVAVTPIAPAPIYVVNQGPEYSGPGIMVPYRTWTPAGPYVAPGTYPYFSGYGYGGYRHAVHRRYLAPRRYVAYRHYVAPRRHILYRVHLRARPRYYRPAANWRFYPRHPLTHH